MALVLGTKIGDVVDVADRWIRVLSVENCSHATLLCDDGRKLVVSANDLTCLMPDVWVGLGLDPVRGQLRLLFEAPRHVPITRRHG